MFGKVITLIRKDNEYIERFPTTMNVMMPKKNKTKKLCLNNSTHVRSSLRDTDDIAQGDCVLPILS